MSDNLAIWNAVRGTDKAFTRRVKQRGGFTTINAQYQLQRATEFFGPLGVGWGYTAEYGHFSVDDITVVQYADVVLWYVWEGERRTFGPVRGMNLLRYLPAPTTTNPKPRVQVDDDAAKKAMTDAITKALSQLGFSADIYLGLWDDNKYAPGPSSKTHQPTTTPPTPAAGSPAPTAGDGDYGGAGDEGDDFLNAIF